MLVVVANYHQFLRVFKIVLVFFSVVRYC